MTPLFTVHWLGTSSGLPTRDRDLSCLVMQVGTRLILLDAGEGTQLNLLRRGFNISAVDLALITHVHGDHLYGLPGFLGTLWLMGQKQPLVIGDRQVFAYLEAVDRTTAGGEGRREGVRLDNERRPRQVFDGYLKRDLQVIVSAIALDHRVPAHGFRVTVRRHHAAKVNVAALEAAGVPRGPAWGAIQRGEDVTLPSGEVLRAKALRQPPWYEEGSFVYLTDTRYCQASVTLAQGADLVSHEATFLPGQEERAYEMGHSTAGDALRVLEESGARELVLTHFSARNSEGEYDALLKAHPLGERAPLAHDG